MAMDYAFDSSALELILVDATSPEGILQAELESEIKSELTKMVMDPGTTKIPGMVESLLAEYERRGLIY